ncbi:uncharacterized protein LTR77_000254 [Saxophila tyrrhenica]|uniref:FAD-binding domain-containing protein n=1 Tax=Saxophila tyrrhenica TaxID=1690608 RepID=A0AAV9PQA5_9PEZI|nr:hypothetical protein LTR77_000254 [Saxophila tyrrhenica]
MVTYCKHTGERLMGPMEFSALTSDPENAPKIYRHSRPKFHAMLLDQLAEVGLSVEYGKEAVDFFEGVETGRAGVVVRDGSRYDADLVVAADGVRTRSWNLVAGKEVPAVSSGDAIFRAAYPVELALIDPVVMERFKLLEDGRSVIELWDFGTAQESWGNRVHPEEVLKYTATIDGWSDIGDCVIKTIPSSSLVDWKVMWRDPQPQWTSPGGRVCQLGDAAHTFLPSSGNGATQAIEDAVSLAACISMGRIREGVPNATRVHNLLRFERVSCLQAFGVVNRKKANSGGQTDDKPKDKLVRVGRWILEHDPELYALENYAGATAHLAHGTPFQNTNTPKGLVYMPWTIQGLLEAQEKGEATILDGDWD